MGMDDGELSEHTVHSEIRVTTWSSHRRRQRNVFDRAALVLADGTVENEREKEAKIRIVCEKRRFRQGTTSLVNSEGKMFKHRKAVHG